MGAPVDAHVLTTMVESIGPEVTTLVVQAYLSSAPQRMSALQDATDAGGQPLRAAAHVLTASSATVGATALADLCWEVEAAVARDDEAQARSAAFAAIDQLETVVAWLSSSPWAGTIA